MSGSKKSNISKIFNELKNTWDRFKESKVGKVLFSNSLSYAITLTGVVIAVSGLFTPVSPLIIAAASIGAIGVGIQAINETIKIRNLRRLHKENNLLLQNRNAKVEQDYILALEPSLNDVLKNELFTLPEKEKRLDSDKYRINSKKLKSIGIVLTNNIGGLASTLSSGLSGNVIDILKAAGYGILTSASLITDGLKEKEKIELDTIFKSNINEEWKKEDTPNYKNLTQLENYTKTQVIQTLALKKLITDENYWGMKDEDKKKKFAEIKNNFEMEIKEQGAKAFFAKNKITIDVKKENYLRNIKRVFNPFYQSPNKVKELSPLAKTMNKKSSKTITH